MFDGKIDFMDFNKIKINYGGKLTCRKIFKKKYIIFLIVSVIILIVLISLYTVKNKDIITAEVDLKGFEEQKSQLESSYNLIKNKNQEEEMNLNKFKNQINVIRKDIYDVRNKEERAKMENKDIINQRDDLEKKSASLSVQLKTEYELKDVYDQKISSLTVLLDNLKIEYNKLIEQNGGENQDKSDIKSSKIVKQLSGKLRKTNKQSNNIFTEASHVETGFTESSEKMKDNYNKKRKVCDYFFNLVLICFLMIFLNGCYFWVIFAIFSRPKNKYYCFDSDNNEFKICEIKDFCPISGVRNIIYLDNISNISIKTEMKNINDKYIDFYVKEATIFSLLNKKISRKKSTMSKFGVTIVSTYKENYLLKNTFRTGCENYMLNVVISILLGTIFGNIIFGYIGDIFGRKKVIIIAHFIEIIGCLMITFTAYASKSRGNIITNEEFHPFNNTKMFGFDYTKDDYYHIQNFIRYFKLKYFESSNMNKIYEDKYNTIIKEILESKYINEDFMKLRFLFVFGFFLVFASNSSLKSTILAFLLENALTEYSMNSYFLYYNFTFPLSLFFSIFLITTLDSFHTFMLIICLMQLILVIVFIICFYESQRFNFEYAFYTRITDFAVYILGEYKLKKYYSEDFRYNDKIFNDKEKVQVNLYYSKDTKDHYKIKNELNNNEENETCTFLSSFLENEENKKSSKNKKDNSIKRKHILGHPSTIFSLMKKEKLIKSHTFLVFSFIFSLAFVTNISFSKITSPGFITRDKSLNSDTITIIK